MTEEVGMTHILLVTGMISFYYFMTSFVIPVQACPPFPQGQALVKPVLAKAGNGGGKPEKPLQKFFIVLS